MTWPNRHLAAILHAVAGQLVRDSEGRGWRWDGQDWQALVPGDMLLGADTVSWFRWDGRVIHPVSITAGAIVRVTWLRDGVDWRDQLCVVVDVDANPQSLGETLLLVESWPEGEGYAVVPWITVELAAPIIE